MQLEFPPSTLGGNIFEKNRPQDDMGPPLHLAFTLMPICWLCLDQQF